jgi:hypothetical protein
MSPDAVLIGCFITTLVCGFLAGVFWERSRD